MPEEFGKYRLLSKLARGGMAEIFLAELSGARGKPVVIKRVLPELSTQVDFVQMFLDEARIAAQLHHPNLVHIFDLGEVSFIDLAEITINASPAEVRSVLVGNSTAGVIRNPGQESPNRLLFTDY